MWGYLSSWVTYNTISPNIRLKTKYCTINKGVHFMKENNNKEAQGITRKITGHSSNKMKEPLIEELEYFLNCNITERFTVWISQQILRSVTFSNAASVHQ